MNEEKNNAVMPLFWGTRINIDEVGKDGKFVEFKEKVYVDIDGKVTHKDPPEYVLPDHVHSFYSNAYIKEKLTFIEKYEALELMIENLNKQIEKEANAKFYDEMKKFKEEREIFYKIDKMKEVSSDLSIKIWEELHEKMTMQHSSEET